MQSPRRARSKSLFSLATFVSIWCVASGALAQPMLPAAEYTPNAASASSTSGTRVASNVFDNRTSTYWSSTVTATSPGDQYLDFSWSQGKQKINYVKILPRRLNNAPVGYPDYVRLAWRASSTDTTYHGVPTSTDAVTVENGWFVVRLAHPVYTDGMRVSGYPGKDENNNYAFQIAEIRAGYSGDERPANAPPLALGDAHLVSMATATGDFNGDGYGDVAVGAPFQVVNGLMGAGAVHMYYGSPQGLSKAQVFTQDSPGMLDSSQVFDLFGVVLASGNFDGDPYGDLAIAAGNNQVQVLYGSSNGLTSARNQILMQGVNGIIGLPEENDRFGASLAAGDFDHDGKDDLAIGIPGEDLVEVPSRPNAGAVSVIYGGDSGLTSRDQLWSQLSEAIDGSPEADDQFGEVLAVGDFNRDLRDDLAVGVPSESVGSRDDAGAVNVIHGSPSGLNATFVPDQIWYEDWPVEVAGESLAYERFGQGMTTGDFNGDGYSDLVIGVPGHATSATVTATGAVHILYGSGGALSLAGAQFFTKNPTKDDGLGYWFTSGNFNGDKRTINNVDYPIDDLVIGVPHREIANFPNIASPGVVYVMNGSSTGVNTASTQTWSLEPAAIPLQPAEYDLFGGSLATTDIKRDFASGATIATDDLIIGAPFKQDPTYTGSGTFTVLYSGTSGGLKAAESKTIHEDRCDYLSEPQDCMDFDGDGAPTGLERLAQIIQSGQTDENGSTDADGDLIPDGIEIAGYNVATGQLITRSEPKAKKSIYVVLPYTPGVSGFDANTTRDNVQAYFSADTSTFDVKVFMAPVASAQVPGFHDSCINTLATENYAPASQLGWFSSDSEVNALFNSGTEAATVEKYAHVGRVCLNGDSSVVARGAIQYNGGWQFMVRMRPPGPNTDLTKWHRALASLIAHELGHSLGLNHGGDTLDDCSPLYPSVMNHGYDFQLDTSGPCSTIGFSKGVLAVADETKRLQLRAGDANSYGSWEYNILSGMHKNTASGLQPLSAVPTVAGGGPPDLDFLSCWAKGDTNILTPRVAQCGGTSAAPIWCGNWDGDDIVGTAEYCVDAAGNWRIIPVEGCADNESIQTLSADSPYDAVSIFQARTSQGYGADIVSGCAPADLGATDADPYPLPSGALKDHDDFKAISDKIPTTLSRSPRMCTPSPCGPVKEPVSLGQVDAFSGWW